MIGERYENFICGIPATILNLHEKMYRPCFRGGEIFEILIVDDGSKKDNTAAVADSYQEKYPTIVKAIHQENGGHRRGCKYRYRQCQRRLLQGGGQR